MTGTSRFVPTRSPPEVIVGCTETLMLDGATVTLAVAVELLPEVLVAVRVTVYVPGCA